MLVEGGEWLPVAPSRQRQYLADTASSPALAPTLRSFTLDCTSQVVKLFSAFAAANDCNTTFLRISLIEILRQTHIQGKIFFLSERLLLLPIRLCFITRCTLILRVKE